MAVSPIDLQKALSGASYPASRDDLVGTAQSNGASTEIRQALEQLSDKVYDSPAAVEHEARPAL